MDDSDCFSISGAGTPGNPFLVDAILDADSDNLTTCSVAGLLTQLPTPLIHPPTVLVYHAIDQAVGAGASAYLDFSLEYYDSDTMHDTVTNKDRVTFNTPGVYAVTFQGQWKANVALGDREVKIRKNGTDYQSADARTNVFEANGTTPIGIKVSLSHQAYYLAGDYIQVEFQNRTVATALFAEAAPNAPILGATWLRGAP